MRCSRSRSSAAVCCARARDGRRLLRVRPGELRVVAGLVAARDRARPPPAADEPRLRARRLEPRLDELHPRAVAAGLAAHGGRRAGRDLRRPGAGGSCARRLVHVSALPRAAHGARGRAGGRARVRLRHVRDGRDAQPPQPRARLHAPARRPRGRALPARNAVGSALRRALRALRRRRVRDVPGDALLGDARRRLRAGRRRSRSRTAASARGSFAASCCPRSRMPSRSSLRRRTCGSHWPTPIPLPSAATASSSTSPT